MVCIERNGFICFDLYGLLDKKIILKLIKEQKVQ